MFRTLQSKSSKGQLVLKKLSFAQHQKNTSNYKYNGEKNKLEYNLCRVSSFL